LGGHGGFVGARALNPLVLGICRRVDAWGHEPRFFLAGWRSRQASRSAGDHSGVRPKRFAGGGKSGSVEVRLCRDWRLIPSRAAASSLVRSSVSLMVSG